MMHFKFTSMINYKWHEFEPSQSGKILENLDGDNMYYDVVLQIDHWDNMYTHAEYIYVLYLK